MRNQYITKIQYNFEILNIKLIYHGCLKARVLYKIRITI